MSARAGLVLAVCATAGAGCGGVIHGRVFVDVNGDGVRDPDEPGVAGVRVFFESTDRTTTDAAGDFILATSSSQGIAWAWTPDGFRPGPSYTQDRDPDDGVVDIPLESFAGPDPVKAWSFAVASDTHMVVPIDARWDGGELGRALDQMLAPAPFLPVFFTILGDVAQGGRDEELELVEEALGRTSIPFVGVTGNHDLHEPGAWRRRFGPLAYGFDVAGVRFLVWNGFVDDSVQVELLHLVLDGQDPSATIVGLGHASPRDSVAATMAELGVDYLLTGHWHANRRVDRFGIVEWATQPLMMGGLDHGPAGYRVVTVDQGRLSTTERSTLRVPIVALAAPVDCVAPGPVPVIAIAAIDAGAPTVTAQWGNSASAVALAPRGGWAYAGTLPAMAGIHDLVVTASSDSGRSFVSRTTLTSCTTAPPIAPVAGVWPQIQGGPEHLGASAATVAGIAPAWTVAVGGPIAAGSPIVAGDNVYIAVTDFEGGDHGGVVALDLGTGRERWRFTTLNPVRNAVAVDRGVVVIADSGGRVHGVDAATGRARWSRDLAEGTDSWNWHLWQPPTIVDGVVYIGTQATFAAIDVETGALRWTRSTSRDWPWLGPTAAATPVGDRILVVSDRESGLWLGDRATGHTVLAVPSDDFLGIAGAPLALDGRAYVTNTYGNVVALDPATLGIWWRSPLVPRGDAWSESIVTNLATAGGRLFAATQDGVLAALEVADGAVAWRAAAPAGPLTVAHYASDGAGYGASPVVTGDLVWIGGVDGVLRAYDVATGQERERHVLGSPILSGVAPVEGGLVAATFGGTVHMLVTPRRHTPDFPWQVFPAGLLVFLAGVAVLRRKPLD